MSSLQELKTSGEMAAGISYAVRDFQLNIRTRYGFKISCVLWYSIVSRQNGTISVEIIRDAEAIIVELADK
ncbi:hypothetical protein DSBG_2707 [Desulfosporosinus sp. BG]|nr:hypothetical protein DSBG_2707 [Desulfosporosinus sp. BG]